MENTGPSRVFYVIEGDMILLSEDALKDLGCISETFPRLGEYGGKAYVDWRKSIRMSKYQDNCRESPSPESQSTGHIAVTQNNGEVSKTTKVVNVVGNTVYQYIRLGIPDSTLTCQCPPKNLSLLTTFLSQLLRAIFPNWKNGCWNIKKREH